MHVPTGGPTPCSPMPVGEPHTEALPQRADHDHDEGPSAVGFTTPSQPTRVGRHTGSTRAAPLPRARGNVTPLAQGPSAPTSTGWSVTSTAHRVESN